MRKRWSERERGRVRSSKSKRDGVRKVKGRQTGTKTIVVSDYHNALHQNIT
jgi:hypothetical protein